MRPFFQTAKGKLYHGDCLEVLQQLPESSIQCCVTSPPYWGLRDYGEDGQLGLEPTPEEYVQKMVAIFREIRRVLRDDGTVWLNLGDSYAANRGNGASGIGEKQTTNKGANLGRLVCPTGLKPKDLIGIPWMVAFALRADGWYLRQDIIWHKPNPMPESVTDRCTKSHEYIFLLSKSDRYYCDMNAIKEPVQPDSIARYDRGRSGDHKWANGGPGNQTIARSFSHMRGKGNAKSFRGGGTYTGGRSFNNNEKVKRETHGNQPNKTGLRNRRSVWHVSTYPYSEAHFATFPPDLIKPCIKAGCPRGSTTLDPFFGSGTTGLVAQELGRRWIGIELSAAYCDLAKRRIPEGYQTHILDICDTALAEETCE